MFARFLPDFYKTEFSKLPDMKETTRDDVIAFLREDNKHGVVVVGEMDNIAVWTGDEDGNDDAYYTQSLPLEDPGDANFIGTAAEAVDDALSMSQQIIW